MEDTCESKLFIDEWFIKGKWIAFGLWIDEDFRNLLERVNKVAAKPKPIRRLRKIRTLEEFENLDTKNIVNYPKDDKSTYVLWRELNF